MMVPFIANKCALNEAQKRNEKGNREIRFFFKAPSLEMSSTLVLHPKTDPIVVDLQTNSF